MILDAGTGSGCIALALKKEIREAKVSAFDISEAALKVARQNAEINRLEVDFFSADMLNFEKKEWPQYDVIVSNPPYVREMEKSRMQKNVLNYEPQLALFVPDNHPLVFYEKLAALAQKQLRKNGSLFLEINENFSLEIKKLFEQKDFKKIEVRKDIRGKYRMVRCVKS